MNANDVIGRGCMAGGRKLNIFLADLTHTGIRIANENFPLNVGLIGSYALKKFPFDIQIRLFKYPEKLLDALKHEKCDILGCSTYVWNNNLSEQVFEIAKSYNPDVLTVRGGPNFPLEDKQQEEYLRRYKYTDIYCLGEGVDAFANIIERVLGTNDISGWGEKPIDGSVFLNPKNKVFTKGSILPRIVNLDEIPSPYTTGLLDEFFDGNLTPVITTTKGCPFSCNYCNFASSYYNKVNFCSIEYVVKEINYIAKRVASKGISNLILAENNFGMYPRDKEISIALRETQKKYKWPLCIIVSTGKNKVESVFENTEVLGDAITISMSVQSMNPDTLKAIERSNIDVEMYNKIARVLEEKRKDRVAEVIVPLPEETYSSYMSGIEKLIDIGASAIVSYTLGLHKGTIYTNEDFRKKYGYQGKYRIVPNDFGTYEGKKVFDYEEVATFSKSLSFSEYLEIRKFTLIIELLFNNSIVFELFKFLGENGVNTYSFLKYILEELENAPEEVKEVFDSFVSETENELKDSEESLINFYSDETNYKKLKTGEHGGNIVYKNKGRMLSKNNIVPWLDYITKSAIKILELKEGGDKSNECVKMLGAINLFIASKLDGLLISERTSEDVIIDIEYDILAWLNDEHGKRLNTYKAQNKLFRYRFYFDEDQKIERNDLFSRYTSDISGLSKIMARLMAFDRIFRRVEKLVVFQQFNYGT